MEKRKESVDFGGSFTDRLENYVLNEYFKNNVFYVVLTNKNMSHVLFKIVKKKKYVPYVLEDLKGMTDKFTHTHVFNTCV